MCRYEIIKYVDTSIYKSILDTRVKLIINAST